MYDSARDKNTDIYLIPTAGGAQKRVTMHHTDDRHASWSPDGHSLLFHSGRGGGVNIWQVEIPDLEPSELEDATLPGISIVSTIGLVTLMVFMRRKSYV